MSTNPEHGLTYWRSLEQLAESPQVQQQIAEEFPGYDPKTILSLSRRKFVKLMAASTALAGIGLSGCRRWPKEALAPFVSRPTDRIPGVEEYYATNYEIGGVSIGALAESFDGRPIKIEGNPSHPFARTFEGDDRAPRPLGASTAMMQASVLDVYDPNRSARVVYVKGANEQERFRDWAAFEQAIRPHLEALGGNGGSVAVLSEVSDSPSLQDMRQRFEAAFRGARWFEYDAVNRDNEMEGARVAFGQLVRPRLHLDRADVIVSLDADLLAPTHPASLRYANDWVKRRKSADQGRMSRMYVAESMLSITGTVADERLPLRPSQLARVAAALAARLGGQQGTVEGLPANVVAWIDRAANDLRAAGRNGVVTAGLNASPDVHAIAHQINTTLGAVGQTVTYLADPVNRPTSAAAVRQLVDGINNGQITTLFILGGNPVFDAPADLNFADAMKKLAMSVRLGLYFDETSDLSTWHLPRAHYLECWGDGRAWDGTIALQQPIILPLYDGKSPIELLAMLANDEQKDAQAIVQRVARGYIRGAAGGDFDRAWRKALHDGVVEGTALQPQGVQARGGNNLPAQAGHAGGTQFEVRLQPSYSLYDGRYAPNGWLLEAPHPITKLTWDNAALMNKVDADEIDAKDGTIINVNVGGRSIDVPVFILPGQPRGVIGVEIGWGRKYAGGVGNDVGFDAYPIRTTAAMWSAPVQQLLKPGRTHAMVTTQHHHMLDASGEYAFEKRIGTQGNSGKIVRQATLDEFRQNGKKAFLPDGYHPTVELQLFESPYTNPRAHPDAPEAFNDPHAWGMVIDMSACIGCNACVLACQAENNIPIVGKDNVAANREMHWLRIDRYFKGQGNDSAERAADPNPEVVHMPMFCVHCENAPCEQVCPVAATVHDTEGLNTMVYNRCIGTRYCSNNCPYKVRRFNYYDWHSIPARDNRFPMPWPFMPDSQQKTQVAEVRKLGFNPGVTVRMRGVMEKCTYCTQRIWDAKITAKNEWMQGKREKPLVKDWEIVTACQQSCPTEALIFGNLNDPKAVVLGQQKSARAYSVLEDLNTRPRTKHLALVRNPAAKKEAATTPEHQVF